MNRLDPVVLSQSGPSLIFAHANGYPPETYRSFLEPFLAQYQVQMVYLRPFWPGSDPGSLKDWRLFRDDYLAFFTPWIESIKKSKSSSQQVLGVGHSLGAMTTLMAAIIKPEDFRALVLIEPVLFPQCQGWVMRKLDPLRVIKRFHPMVRRTLKRKTHFPDRETMFHNYRGKPIFQRLSDQVLEDYVTGLALDTAEGGITLRYSPAWEAKIYETGGSADWFVWSNLDKVTCPVLVIRGEETYVLRDHNLQNMIHKLPAGKSFTIPGTGHLVPLEAPRKTAEVVLDFLKDI